MSIGWLVDIDTDLLVVLGEERTKYKYYDPALTFGLGQGFFRRHYTTKYDTHSKMSCQVTMFIEQELRDDQPLSVKSHHHSQCGLSLQYSLRSKSISWSSFFGIWIEGTLTVASLSWPIPDISCDVSEAIRKLMFLGLLAVVPLVPGVMLCGLSSISSSIVDLALSAVRHELV